jgi:hypothetical protein
MEMPSPQQIEAINDFFKLLSTSQPIYYLFLGIIIFGCIFFVTHYCFYRIDKSKDTNIRERTLEALAINQEIIRNSTEILKQINP